MTTLFIATSISGSSSPVVNLDTGGYDGFQLEPAGSVQGTGATTDGIVSTAAGIHGIIDGRLISGHDGLYLSAGAATVQLGTYGLASGGTCALAFGSGDDTIVNHGDVGGGQIGVNIVDGARTTGNSITNTGVIVGSGALAGSLPGMGVYISGGGGNSITNSGVITGGYGIAINDAAGDAPDTITNSGTIAGGLRAAIITGAARATVTNTGSIFGFVLVRRAGSVVVNSGKVHGGVNFLAGGRYDGSRGSVTGQVAGSGTCLFAGGRGADRFNIQGALAAGSRLDGGGGADTVTFDADFSSGLTFAPTTMVNVETVKLSSGYSYRMTFNDATVAAGRRLTIDASALAGPDHTILDASAETDGAYTMKGGAGNDTFIFKPSHFSAADSLQGGAGGTDTLLFSQAGTVAAGALANVKGVEAIALTNGANSIQLTNALVASAHSGSLTVIGGTGADAIDASRATSGGNYVHFVGNGGADTLTASRGFDTFVYNAVGDSTGPHYDTIIGVNFQHDLIAASSIGGAVTGVHAAVAAGALSTASFNTDLASAIGASRLAAHHALEFRPSSGTLAGGTFLIVDANGVAGYQANADLVIRLSGATGTLSSANFV